MAVMGGRLTLANLKEANGYPRSHSVGGKGVPAFDFSSLIPKLHGRKSALSFGNVYGFHVISTVKSACEYHAVIMVQE